MEHASKYIHCGDPLAECHDPRQRQAQHVTDVRLIRTRSGGIRARVDGQPVEMAEATSMREALAAVADLLDGFDTPGDGIVDQAAVEV